MSQSKPKTIIFIVVILIIIAAVIGYFMWQRNDSNKQKDQTVKTASQTQESSEPTNTTNSETATPADKPTSVQPKQATLENIQAAFESKNTAVLEGYMAPTVLVVYAASEMGKELPPADAVKAMDYVNSGAVAPWDFALSPEILASYANGDYKQYFTSTTLVGRASNGFVVAVNFNADGKISGIFVSASDELL